MESNKVKWDCGVRGYLKDRQGQIIDKGNSGGQKESQFYLTLTYWT